MGCVVGFPGLCKLSHASPSSITKPATAEEQMTVLERCSVSNKDGRRRRAGKQAASSELDEVSAV
jgi:hypothetical protein